MTKYWHYVIHARGQDDERPISISHETFQGNKDNQYEEYQHWLVDSAEMSLFYLHENLWIQWKED